MFFFMMEIVILVFLLYMIIMFVSSKMEKYESMVSSFECGFDSHMGSRVSFSYRFFLISILFLIFDVEITLLIPLPYSMEDKFQMCGLWWFMVILLWGLIYEYFNGVLSWSDVGMSKS